MIRPQGWFASGFGDNFTFLAYVIILATFISTSWRRFALDARDPYKCEALATDGQWLDKPLQNGSRLPFENWQAPGCLTHRYNAKDIATCIGKRKIVLAGDSTVRQVYYAITRKLGEPLEEQQAPTAEKHSDHSYSNEDVTVEFLWDPFLNQTRTFEYLSQYRDAKDGKANVEDGPALMLLGSGAWYARWYTLAAGLKAFTGAIENVSRYTSFKQTLSQTLSSSSLAEVGDQVFIQPVQLPAYDKLPDARKQTILKGEIEAMNLYLEDVSLKNNVLWSFLAMTDNALLDVLDPTGFHAITSVTDAKADVLLNLRCNAKLDKTAGYPMDRTCCSNYRPMVWTQWLLLAAGLVVAVLAIRAATAEKQDPERDALLFFAGTLFYCYLADRSQLFDHVKKFFNETEFFLLCGITFLAGVLTIRRSGKPNANGVVKDQPFLSRDQTEEWKGWMQFLILIYHWTGASSTLWIYQGIRVLVASYLFLTGFGHTCYFLKKGDFGFKRVAGVLVRLNLLSCALPYVMGTDYLFYYFAPLVTFWFGVIWLTMRVYATRNTSTAFVLGKILVAGVLVTVLLELPAFDILFDALKVLCRITWDAHEWKFRVALDRYIVFVGMIVAVFYERYNEVASSGNLTTSFGFMRNVAIVASIIALPASHTIFRYFDTKQASNMIHPYLAAAPILAFVILRNASPAMRDFHSTLFAWLGKCSLETFTLQFHIWMAADTRGLLSLGIFRADGSLLGDRWRDFVVLTPLFFWISWKLAGATGVITAYLLKENKGDADESTEGLLEKGVVARTRNLWTRISQWVWPNDLRIRVGVLLAIMWFLNVTW